MVPFQSVVLVICLAPSTIKMTSTGGPMHTDKKSSPWLLLRGLGPGSWKAPLFEICDPISILPVLPADHSSRYLVTLACLFSFFDDLDPLRLIVDLV
jgi:hypothetical protein